MTSRKPTRQQGAVLEMLSQFDDFTTAQELHARLRADGQSVGLATVYRALQSFAGDGVVDVLRNDEGEAAYRRCSTTHHHHLVCRSCGRTVEIEGQAVEAWTSSVSKRHGFSDVSHHVEIFGVCTPCSTSTS